MTKPKNTNEAWRLTELDHGWILETGDGLAGDYIADFHKHVGGCADDERDRARAVLAAAAPDLAEACATAAAIFGSEPDEEIPPERRAALYERITTVRAKLRAVLAKAGAR